MPYLVGMDEAGYGPNLGPLVISASVWWVPDNPPAFPRRKSAAPDLYKRLKSVVTRGPGSKDAESDFNRLAIADSKQLYHSGSGLAALERGVLSALHAVGHRPRTWHEVWETLAGESGAHRRADPWYAMFASSLPRDCNVDDCDSIAARLAAACERSGVRCCALASRGVFPDEFNVLSTQLDSKGAALTQLTLDLLRETLQPLAGACVYVVCDKHGGRNYYATQLQQRVTELLVEIHGESTAESIYRWGPAESRVEVRFCAGGEAFLPAALASMTSKYLRELALLAFNDFWCARVPELRPTAGYPEDARRFKRQIAAEQAALAIEDHVLWRDR